MKITVLTGAGISAESGLRTFRDDDGLWENHRVEDVATPQAFRRNPELVQRFYNMRRADAAKAEPNAAHRALAQLAQVHDLMLVTQNVDDLHERGGSADVVHMHGALAGALCAGCGHRWPAPMVMNCADACPACGEPLTRPDIVWFGEMPYRMEEIWARLENTDLFAAIGTSGNVYPAAGFVQHTRRHGARTVELNLQPSAVFSDFEDSIQGAASKTVPAWVESLL